MTGLTACVVNYNGAGRVERCVAALRASSRVPSEIIVVDNASTDGSAESLQKDFPGVQLIRLDRNAGPPAARNAGRAAARHGLVLFIDNDVCVAERCIEELISAQRDTDAAVVMPRVCYANSQDVIQYDGAGCHPLGLMLLRNQDVPLAEAGQSLHWMNSVVTACFLVDLAKLPMDTLFDEHFFFNYEDHDFGIRCRIAGAEIAGTPAALCHHGEGTPDLSYREGRSYSDRRSYYLIRNRWLILLTNYRVTTLLALLPALALYEAFQLLGVSVRGWFPQWIRAVGWIVAHPKLVWVKRRNVQATRRLDDFDRFDLAPLPLTPSLSRNSVERGAIVVLDRFVLGYCRLINRLRAAIDTRH